MAVRNEVVCVMSEHDTRERGQFVAEGTTDTLLM